MIFHRIFKDGSPTFIESLRGRAQQLFALRRFSSVAPASMLVILLLYYLLFYSPFVLIARFSFFY
jgi:hypothetical protein